MPYAPVLIVKAILNNRHRINDHDQRKKICGILFDFALRDCDAAEALFAKPNRFIQIIPDAISEEKLLKFAHTHNSNLVKKLIDIVKLSNEKLVQKMKQAALEKQKLDQQFNDLLKRTQPIEREPLLPQGRGQENGVIGRTYLAIQKNPLIRGKDNIKGIMLSNEFIPMVTRKTRDFNKKLCSIGASTAREVILLDPDDQILKLLYQFLKEQLQSNLDPQVILGEVKKLTRNCFTGTKVDNLIKENLANDKPIISLSEFILRGQGVCRHHTLLNAYFLSRLVQDGLLHGEVIHHRQNFDQKRAHTWNVFHAKNGKVYSLDSLWDDVTCITDNPGTINSLYCHNVETIIEEMHFSATPPPSNAEKINQIKHYIENTNFSIGDYCLWKGGLILKLEDGSEKRVPHRVYEIYQAIITNHSITQELWQSIKMHAQQALDHPRPGRGSKTTAFYNNIVNDTIFLLEDKMNIPSANQFSVFTRQ